jgi:hypothetical protein
MHLNAPELSQQVFHFLDALIYSLWSRSRAGDPCHFAADFNNRLNARNSFRRSSAAR